MRGWLFAPHYYRLLKAADTSARRGDRAHAYPAELARSADPHLPLETPVELQGARKERHA